MKKIGFLGGGQLGRMLLQASVNYDVATYILENDINCPSAHLCHHFIKGNIANFEDVYNFGKLVNVLTIEIENINIEALEKLEAEGLEIIPKVSVIKTIKNKIIQKQFYEQNGIPSASFIVTNSIEDVLSNNDFLPAVHKIGEGGYDGKGVVILNDERDIENAFKQPSVLEKKIDIAKEISLIVAIDKSKRIVIYPPVEMIVNPYLHLLDYQISPAELSQKVLFKAEAIAFKLAKVFDSPGIFAIEMLIDYNEEVWVNETAPRVHNSGHHTIEANYCSQFDMLLRIMLDLPLGSTKTIMPSSLINIIGVENYEAKPEYTWLNEMLTQQSTYVHLYGKEISKPGRKMGHITVLGNDLGDVKHKANVVKEMLG